MDAVHGRHRPRAGTPEPVVAAIAHALLGADACRALELLGRGPGGACYVGDARTDMQAAAAAGVDGIAVPWGSFGADALREAGAVHVATSADALRALLGVAR